MDTKDDAHTHPVKNNLGDGDRQAGIDQRAGNESRDLGSDRRQADDENVTLGQSLRRQVDKDDKEQQAEGAKTAEELGIEVDYPSDGLE